MITGFYSRGNTITEVSHGGGMLELIPSEVVPSLKPVNVDAPFYFFAKMDPQKRSWKNLVVCASVIGPMIGVSLLNGITNDVLFTGLCWASIVWAGVVIFANCRRRK